MNTQKKQKILIATKNDDKFAIAKALIDNVFPERFEFIGLNDIETDFDIEEIGSIEDRARDKARTYWTELNRLNKLNEMYAAVGIDDGFSASADAPGDPNSKELTDKILSGAYLVKDETIWLKRAFAVANDELGILSAMTSIPFRYLGNSRGIVREEGVYPLSRALGPLGSSKTISQMDFNESIEYYLGYCKNELKKLSF
jgi:hypothetical protein